MSVYLIFDFAVVVLLFAMIFKFLPDAQIQWRDVWIGAVMTAILFCIGKMLVGFYLGSGAAGSAYGAGRSLIKLVLWAYYLSPILLFGGEFTQVSSQQAGAIVRPYPFSTPVRPPLWSCPIAPTVRATSAVATPAASLASIDNFMAFPLDVRFHPRRSK